MLQMGDTVGLRYTTPKISAISYLLGTFSLLIMGDTEQPRYTGFRSLSVRGITALQCILFKWFSYTKCLCPKKDCNSTKNLWNIFKKLITSSTS